MTRYRIKGAVLLPHLTSHFDALPVRRTLTLLFPLLLLAPAVSAQSLSISGRVTDATSGAPLPGVHVFIAQSMTGTTTNAEGEYTLTPLPPGAHRVYVSILGYEPEARDVMLRPEEGPMRQDFQLSEAVLELEGVEVVGQADPNWRRHLEKFIRLFIGETPNAAHTEIMNPEVLSFEDRVVRFTAVASEPLIIENRALGYRIQYFLREFAATPTRVSYDGEGLYEEMPASTPELAQRWGALRQQAWYGSWRHFILSVLDNDPESQGYRIFSRPDMGEMTVNPSMASAGGGSSVLSGRQRFPIKAKDLYKKGETALEKTLDFHGFVEIIFTGEMEPEHYRAWRSEAGAVGDRPQTSWIRLERGPAVVDYKGDVLDPYGVTFYGFLAYERVADELPREYRPE